MRENMGLYRGKRKDTLEWVYGYLCVSKGVTHIFVPFTKEQEKQNEGHIFSSVGGMWYEVIPETVGQYTGVTDMQGVKVFEGDIVPLGFVTCVVRYDAENACFMFYVNNEHRRSGFNADTMELKAVTSNIYDHPELFQEAKHNGK